MPRKKNELYYRQLLTNRNIQAYLMTIRKGEGTLGPKGYFRHFGKGSITTLDVRPAHKVYKANSIYSSAVGAYQFLNSDKHPNWDSEANKFGWTDILPIHQDIAALDVIHENGAIQDILDGDIVAAIYKTNRIGASLPGARYNQPTQNLSKALSFYQEQGGVLEKYNQNIVEDGKIKKELTGRIKMPLNHHDLPSVISKVRTDCLLEKKATNTFKENNSIQDRRLANIFGLKSIRSLLNFPDWRSAQKVNNRSLHPNLFFLKNNTVNPAITIAPDQIMRNIFTDHPAIRNKWNRADQRRTDFLNIEDPTNTTEVQTNNRRPSPVNTDNHVSIQVNSGMIGSVTINIQDISATKTDLQREVEEVLIAVFNN